MPRPFVALIDEGWTISWMLDDDLSVDLGKMSTFLI